MQKSCPARVTFTPEWFQDCFKEWRSGTPEAEINCLLAKGYTISLYGSHGGSITYYCNISRPEGPNTIKEGCAIVGAFKKAMVEINQLMGETLMVGEEKPEPAVMFGYLTSACSLVIQHRGSITLKSAEDKTLMTVAEYKGAQYEAILNFPTA